MGTRGPTPQPKAILNLEGSHHARYRRGEDAEYEAKAPTCPAWLAKEAKREWKRVIRSMVSAGTVTKLDQAILCAYCEMVAEFQRLTEEIDGLKDNPLLLADLIKIRHKTTDRIKQYAMQLGFTPASRTRVAPVTTPKKEPRVMSRKRE
jgi:P27 family predicted phage terminase small subunit